MAINIKDGLKITKKIQYLLNSLDSDTQKNIAVEQDLLLGYIRSLYDLVLFENDVVSKPTKQSKKPKKANKEVVVRVEVAQPVITPPVVALPKEIVPPPPPKVTPPPPPKKRVLSEHQDLFSFKIATDLSEKLQDRPVKDLNKAFAINERLLTMSKLFRNDKEAFDETLIKLNSLSSFEEAKIYLSHHLVDSFGWMEKGKFKTAKIFIKTIRRRYL